MGTPAAIYARSSRDRADISIATQIHELRQIARSRGLDVVATFEDAVESGATGDRPSFLKLGDTIKNRKRGWSVLLVYDTSRIARRRYIAQAFKHECRKCGVAIQYAKVPADIDPISELVLDAVFEAMDEVHSLMSKEKAVAGQRENVRRGWRAGGRAPIGYKLEASATGGVREGKPVLKTRLVPSGKSKPISAYLKARAQGIPRPSALKNARLTISKSSLVDLEWNALTYAGHTVWNRHYGKSERRGQAKRRPRNEWTIQRDTHPALITDAEAQALLAALAANDRGAAVSAGKRAASEALLSGLLVTPEGRHWRAAGSHYRLEGKPGRHVRRAALEQLVVEQVTKDLGSQGFIEGMVEAARRVETTDSTLSVRRELGQLRKERDRAARLAIEGAASGTWIALVAERSAQIEALEVELERIGQESDLEQAVRRLTPASLRALIESFEDPARLIQSLVARVTLDRSLVGRIQYRSPPGASRSVSVASPRGFEPRLPP